LCRCWSVSLSPNWLSARLFAAGHGRLWLDLGIALNLAALGLFKYANFLLESLLAVAGRAAPHLSIVLPLGISFFRLPEDFLSGRSPRGDRHVYPLAITVSSSFLSAAHRRPDRPPQRDHRAIRRAAASPADVGESRARRAAVHPRPRQEGGARRHACAQRQPAFAKAAAGTALNVAEGWAAAVSFALQIYFDFSGYSDMAIGLALMFGFRLPFNFDAPYRAASIREFWRRWHMTLSRFLRDYLYIPLGGNRLGAARQAVNVVVTMLLGGLWHGASWTFVAWGGLHGLALAINGAWARRGPSLPRIASWILTMLFVLVGWCCPCRRLRHRVAYSAGDGGLDGFGKVHLDNRAVLYIGLPWRCSGRPASRRYWFACSQGPGSPARRRWR